MITFGISVTALVLLALLFVLPVLLRKNNAGNDVVRNELNLSVMRDQLRELDRDLISGTLSEATFVSARQDLEQRLLEERQTAQPAVSASVISSRSAIAVGLFIPVLVLGLYLLLGNSNGLDPAKVAPQEPTHEITEQQVLQMVANLAKKLESQPNNVEGWNMLARSYNAMGKYNDAVQAYQHLIQIEPKNADYLVSYADTLAVSQNRNLQGEPEKIVKRALELDPQNVRGLSLAGSAAFDRQDYADAVAYWKDIMKLVPPDSEMAKNTLASIGEAQGLMDGGGAGPANAAAPTSVVLPAASSPPASAPAAASKITGTVTLAPGFRSGVTDQDTVYIFARAEQGPPFPLAVKKVQVKDLPLHFVLDETMGVMPGASLAGHNRVLVGARISKSGNATPQAGDVESSLSAVDVGVGQVSLTLNSLHK